MPQQTDKMLAKDFAAELKAKYPQWKDVPDDQLVSAVLEKYPQFKDQIYTGPTEAMTKGASISSQPPITSIAGIKSRINTFRRKQREFTYEALPAVGGMVGGGAGATAGPWTAVGGATLGGMSGEALSQLLRRATGEGKVPQTSSEAFGKITEEGVTQGLSQGVGELFPLLLRLKPLKLDARVAKTGYALKATAGGESVNFAEVLPKAMGDLDKTAKLIGQPKTIGELKNLIVRSTKAVDAEFNAALLPISSMDATATARQIAADIRAAAPGTKTAHDAAITRAMNRSAMDFDSKPWTWGELNAERVRGNTRLDRFYDKNSVVQGLQLRTDAQAAVDKIATGKIREELYGEMERNANAGLQRRFPNLRNPKLKPDYYKTLKQREGALTELNKRVNGRVNELANQTLEQKGEPLLSMVNIYGHPQTGSVGTSFHRAQRLFTTPEKSANRAVRKAFPEPPGPIRRTLSKGQVWALPIRALQIDIAAEEAGKVKDNEQ